MPYLDSPNFSASAGNELICHVCGNHCDRGNKKGRCGHQYGCFNYRHIGPLTRSEHAQSHRHHYHPAGNRWGEGRRGIEVGREKRSEGLDGQMEGSKRRTGDVGRRNGSEQERQRQRQRDSMHIAVNSA